MAIQCRKYCRGLTTIPKNHTICLDKEIVTLFMLYKKLKCFVKDKINKNIYIKYINILL